jgi:2-haloacid dehalogenase
MRELPPHPEVPEALDGLRDAGLRLAALTNNTAEVAEAQLSNAGLSDRFERILSADTVGRLKPAPEPYRAAAEALGVETSQVRLVAAHAWDVAGAMRAGCAAAFVARPGMVLDPLAEPPDVVGTDLSEAAASIIAAET